ncbi:SRPBCC family protein [Luteibaculum oceani]|uniref:AraC effector-binding domain-containing protein n=1 Tax=Luteibaculum oceani TaxID=1294296 RepID=A0A5C6V121_9FLAO|nr:SRPBCC family protein [Luteibaculum oceani]TXC76968.1 hypothetical protein FRX97_10160 [Luteibaculum oceani]
MKVLKFLGFTVLTIVALYLIIAAVSSKDVVVERSTEMPYSPETVFNAVNDFNQYQEWNAWFKLDPNVEYAVSGDGKSIGDTWSWKSDNPNVGEGQMTHKEAVPGKSIINEMTFKGMDGTSSDVWIFEETENGGTAITWKAEMEAPFLMRPFFSTVMESGIGPLFEQSLTNLEAHIEATKWKGFEEGTEGPFEYISIAGHIPVEQMAEFFPKNIAALFAHLEKNNIEPAGAPMGIFYSWGDSTKLEVAIPVADEVKTTKTIKKGSIAEGKAVTYMHVGSHESSEATHYKMDEYIQKKGHEFAGPVVEIYFDNPEEVAEEELRTKIIYFIK